MAHHDLREAREQQSEVRGIVEHPSLAPRLALSLSACRSTRSLETVGVTREAVKGVIWEVQVTRIVKEVVGVALIAEGHYKHLARANAGEFAGEKADIFGVCTGADVKAFQAALAPFQAATDIEVESDSSLDLETLIITPVAGDYPFPREVSELVAR
jgi:hypothetical protein